MSAEQILVIDDEAQIRKLLEITLTANGFAVIMADSGKAGIQLARSHQPELILLDIGLPDLDGQEVLRKLREWYTKPVIMLSVKSAEEEIVEALDNGANDYLVKPFRTGELVARIRSAMRDTNKISNLEIYVNGGLKINFTKRMVMFNDELKRLTAIEYKLLALFAKHEGRVLTHQYLLKEVWGPSHANQTQYLRVFVAQLRKKIETEPDQPRYILTESGVGYRFGQIEPAPDNEQRTSRHQ